eukprot:6151038-Pyramimonas_sp.AAC.1
MAARGWPVVISSVIEEGTYDHRCDRSYQVCSCWIWTRGLFGEGDAPQDAGFSIPCRAPLLA